MDVASAFRLGAPTRQVTSTTRSTSSPRPSSATSRRSPRRTSGRVRLGRRPTPARGTRRVRQVRSSGGWTHGDFQHYNVLWDSGRVSAVLDWDRLRIAPRGYEVARASELQFWNDEGFDLDRVAAFAGGYRAVAPISTADLVASLRARWWNLLCGLWSLDAHYDRDDSTCDHLFDLRCARLVGWCVHEDELRAAATAR